MDVVIAILVVSAVATAIGYPLWRPGPQPLPDPVGPAARIVALEEGKARIYAAIRELGFDYRTDKLLEDDYRAEVEHLKADAVGVVRELDELRQHPPRGPEALESEIAEVLGSLDRDELETDTGEEEIFCTQCGQRVQADDRFCASCGTELRQPR